MTEICLDSSVLISAINGTLPRRAADVLERNTPVIPMIAYAEVARFALKHKGAAELEKIRQKLGQFSILPLDEEVCRIAAETACKHQLALADSLIYATAVRNGIQLITLDTDFRGLRGVILVK